MSLACQKDSYLRELKCVVKSCREASLKQVVNGKKAEVKGYEVVLSDTVLFPEGGGQPDDRGTINGIGVLSVVRRGLEAVHFVTSELKCGEEVHVQVDWSRRWDNMQQHSAQHLISALAISMYQFNTTAWNLGESTSFVELDTAEMTTEQMLALERSTNEKIQSNLKMFPRWIDDKESPEAKEIRCRGLPDDHEGSIRVVTIEDVDVNLCCGTHVSSLAHLQMVKLLGVEKGKKGKVNLVFIAGDRVLRYVAGCFEREKVFTAMLKGGPDDHVDLLQKIQNSLKVAQKNALTLLRESAMHECERLNGMSEPPAYHCLYKKEGDSEFMNIIANNVSNKNMLLFLSCGEERGAGLFLVSGDPGDVQLLGPKIAELLEGRGAGKQGRYQGKCNAIQQRNKVEELIRTHFNR
ncbi:hypothetical protein HELRODRAFT_112439 [Helobdella robusta]|uniref:Alanyl-transfer RNA synthetases family profile domain-containing protein n=1 Tax=Helobdella robusta TaxID=6412 RepID=T1EFK0_HELRO|nr:hypothetical protein HELRODRAFT_112439 [Helobdella robusta]ESO03133.1 hypothetical protein HELRODRAFT_112439 [Helobdella robusta]